MNSANGEVTNLKRREGGVGEGLVRTRIGERRGRELVGVESEEEKGKEKAMRCGRKMKIDEGGGEGSKRRSKRWERMGKSRNKRRGGGGVSSFLQGLRLRRWGSCLERLDVS